MKKTLKKTLSIIVAILMIVTTIPMAFAATEASGLSADIISTAEDEFVDEAQNSATSSTMNGKSEALQTAISQTAVQMENIYKYLMIELKSIEMEAANIMAGNKEYVAGEVKS